jgi:chromosome segregation ATPase
MFNSTKIAALEKRAAEAEARAADAEAELAKLKAGVSDVSTVAAAAANEDEEDEPEMPEESDDKEQDASALVAGLSASVQKLTGRVSELETANASLDKSIDARVSATLAAMGIDPIARANGAADGTKEAPEKSNLKGAARLAAASKVKE